MYWLHTVSVDLISVWKILKQTEQKKRVISGSKPKFLISNIVSVCIVVAKLTHFFLLSLTFGLYLLLSQSIVQVYDKVYCIILIYMYRNEYIKDLSLVWKCPKDISIINNGGPGVIPLFLVFQLEDLLRREGGVNKI